MSLVSLTFGNGSCDLYNNPHIWIETPADRAEKLSIGLETQAEILKACQFVGAEGIYVIAKVTSGCVNRGMRAQVGEKQFPILDLESKHGPKAKMGVQCGILFAGGDIDDFPKGNTIRFS